MSLNKTMNDRGRSMNPDSLKFSFLKKSGCKIEICSEGNKFNSLDDLFAYAKSCMTKSECASISYCYTSDRVLKSHGICAPQGTEISEFDRKRAVDSMLNIVISPDLEIIEYSVDRYTIDSQVTYEGGDDIIGQPVSFRIEAQGPIYIGRKGMHAHICDLAKEYFSGVSVNVCRHP